jgi:hypothetical protein
MYGSPSVRKEAEAIILKIEQFRQQNGRLPDKLEEMGISETSESLIYEKKDNDHFLLKYYSGLDDFRTIYDSSSRHWHGDD